MRRYSNHTLINGAGAGISPPPPENGDQMDDHKIPTWGYKPGESKLFDLNPGEKLPDGWSDSPVSEQGKEEAPRKLKKSTEDRANGDSDGN